VKLLRPLNRRSVYTSYITSAFHIGEIMAKVFFTGFSAGDQSSRSYHKSVNALKPEASDGSRGVGLSPSLSGPLVERRRSAYPSILTFAITHPGGLFRCIGILSSAP